MVDSKVVLSTLRREERLEEEKAFSKNANSLISLEQKLKITDFRAQYEFLSNNFISPVFYEGILYPSVTHAFHAARSNDITTRKAIVNAENFESVLRIATRIEDHESWPNVKLQIMEKLIRDKFRRSSELLKKLQATGNREIVNTYYEETKSNLFWGSVDSKGQNHIGRILMTIRKDIEENMELFQWLVNSFDLVKETKFLPDITFEIFKNGIQIDKIHLCGKSFYFIGSLITSDLKIDHPSASRFHAAIVIDKNMGVVLIDLRSKAGTKVAGEVIADHIPKNLNSSKIKINFAQSTRDYVFNVDFAKVYNAYKLEKKEISKEKVTLQKLEKLNSSLVNMVAVNNSNKIPDGRLKEKKSLLLTLLTLK